MAARGPTSPPAIDALAELRRAPRKVVLRAIERLESAIAGLEADEAVEAGWYLSTASGYAMRVKGRVAGGVALADACALVERLSASIDVVAGDLPEGCLGVKELSARWRVSERTLHRYRAMGLPARSTRSGRTRRLAFTPAVVAAFEARLGGALEAAGSFTRLSASEREAARGRVSELVSQGKSPSSAALVVARELGRSHEAIRQVLRREGGSGGWTVHQRRVALRAHDRFVEPAAIARRLDRDTGATRRIIDAQRLDRLRAMELDVVMLEEPVVPRLPVGAPGPTLLADLVAEMRDPHAPEREMERRLTAYAWYLVGRAARSIESVRAADLRAEPIDSAETDLLWVARLRVEALRPLLGTVLRGVEARLGGKIESLPARQATDRLQLALAAAAEAAHRYDPSRGGRLSAAVTVAVDRASSDGPQPAHNPSAARRSYATWRLDDWTRRVSPWQAFLDAPAALRAGLGWLPEDERALLEARYGLGERPHTMAELAERFGIHRAWIARRLRESARAAMAAGRGRPPADTMGP